VSRLRWMLFGVGVGAGGSWWARRQARRAAARLAPAAVGRRMVDSAGRRIREGWSTATTGGAGDPSGVTSAGASSAGAEAGYRRPRAVQPVDPTAAARVRTGS
jgi:hypothetical protein